MSVMSVKPGQEHYPEKLMRLADPPQRLYIGGRIDDWSQPAVAVVGSRKATPYGRYCVAKLAGGLAARGVHIISGLALGIDGLAHRAALESGGRTTAVLPSGLDRLYPASHQGLAREIIKQGGALISEYEPGTKAAPYHFPARNRIVAALADAVVVIEAAQKSGTLITAEHALDIGVQVLAVPGPINSSTSAGTNRLIQIGAGLVTSVDDIAHALGFKPLKPQPMAPNGESQPVIDLLSRQGQASLEELAAAAEIDIAQANRLMTSLELSGLVRVEGGWWMLA